jgi:hypothetical protein
MWQAGAVLRYVELKTGHSDNGPAWIGRVKESRSGRTVYFNGKAFSKGNGVKGNYLDVETGDEYWISGVKRDGADRHSAGGGPVTIEAAVVEEYLALVQLNELPRTFIVSHDIVDTDISKFHELENRPL